MLFVVLIGSKYTHFRNREVSLVRKHSLGVRGKKKNWKQEKAITGFNSKCSVMVTKKIQKNQNCIYGGLLKHLRIAGVSTDP